MHILSSGNWPDLNKRNRETGETPMPIEESREGRHLPAFSVAKHLTHTRRVRDGVTDVVHGPIDRFTQQYHFLSNFYRVSITSTKYGFTFPSVEHAFQWGKAFYAHDHDRAEQLEDDRGMTPSQAKQVGARVIGLPQTWAQYRVKLMLHLLSLKFQHAGLAGLLRKTTGHRLVEGNDWHENFWGICSCRQCPGYGQNILGRQLEKIREALLTPETSYYLTPGSSVDQATLKATQVL